MSAQRCLKVLFVLTFIWFGFLLMALGSAFLDLKNITLIAAFGMLLVKVVGAAIFIWWIVNVAFAVAEWTDERNGKLTKWD